MDRPGKILTIIHKYRTTRDIVNGINNELEETFDFVVYGKCDQKTAEHIKKWFYQITPIAFQKYLSGELLYSLTSVTHTCEIAYKYKNPTGVIIIEDDKVYMYIGELYVSLATATFKHAYIYSDSTREDMPEHMRLLANKTGHDAIYTNDIIEIIKCSLAVPIIDIVLNDPKISVLESLLTADFLYNTSINVYGRFGSKSEKWYKVNNEKGIHKSEFHISMDKINQSVFIIDDLGDKSTLQKVVADNPIEIKEPEKEKDGLSILKDKLNLGWLLDRFIKTR